MSEYFTGNEESDSDDGILFPQRLYLSQGVVLSTAQTQVEEEEGEDNYNEGYCYK